MHRLSVLSSAAFFSSATKLRFFFSRFMEISSLLLWVLAIVQCENLWIFYSVYLFCLLQKELAFTNFCNFYPEIAAFACVKYLSIQVQRKHFGTIFGILRDFSLRRLFCKGVKCGFGSLRFFVCFNGHSFTDIVLYYCIFFV